MTAMNLGYLLNKVTQLIKWELTDVLKTYQLTAAQWAVLKDTAMMEDRKQTELCTPALIAARLHVEKPAVSRILDRLEISGWILRKNNPGDRRSQFVSLTSKARQLLPELDKTADEVIQRSFWGLTEQELTQLQSQLLRIIQNFEG